MNTSWATLLTLLLMLLLRSLPVHAAEPTIGTLLEAVARQPDILASDFNVQATDIRLKQAHAALFPKLTAFSSYEMYNSPTNLRPMTPTEVDLSTGTSVPFSKQITRYGLRVEMPLFIKELYSLADRVRQLQQASRAGHKLRLVTRQASVVTLDAALAFNSHLDKAICARLESLRKTRDDLRLAVANGRTPESELLKVETLLNDLRKQQNDLQRRALELKSQLRQLTGIQLDQFVMLTQVRPVVEGDFLRQVQQRAEVAAAEKELQGARDRHYPVLTLEGAVSSNRGEAYNTGSSIDRDYDYLGVKLSLPIFDRGLSTAIDQAEIQLRRKRQQLAQLSLDLTAEAASLRAQLPVIARSNLLARTTLDNNRRLLDIARVAFRNGRMTTEEYLRFETRVLDAEAALHRTHVDRWQVISRQAVLYGDELTGVVK
ncbi:hypothetical protein C2E25_04150 [Geothermobacter hydrogeniphilus]|uniref:Outer membrane protein TolC n=1 Tax=Geothermobacter hydrogeniphilus TaxID=1969733 RepID=A0A2K2HCP2_9BACT|nr:TolC family protein [Geothermobacter hydrogeniphilus]PNU21001.1 hypothetical protein C2E25_04150 [Geothermobacter hydrogeniphilus]